MILEPAVSTLGGRTVEQGRKSKAKQMAERREVSGSGHGGVVGTGR